MSMPQFATEQDRQYVQLLMQPALIRIIDNIRKQLDESPWQGSYRDETIWPETASPEQQQQYLSLQAMMEEAVPEDYDRLQVALEQLPTPQHVYTLCLKKQDQIQEVDIWQLCYRLCAQDPDLDRPVQVDMTLFDMEIQDVDWIRLDEKARQLLSAIFAQLPA